MAKKSDYRLQVLFEIREKEKEEAEKVYAKKMALVQKEKKKHDAMKEELREMGRTRAAKKQEYSDKMAAGELNITQINGNDRHIERLKQQEQAFSVEIRRQLEVVHEAEAVAEEAKEAMLKANQDYKALEKHKEKWAKKVKREHDMKEADEAEDIAQAQYFKRLKESRDDV